MVSLASDAFNDVLLLHFAQWRLLVGDLIDTPLINVHEGKAERSAA